MKTFNLIMTVSYDETQTTPDSLSDSLVDILNTHGDGMYSVQVLEITDSE